MILVYYDINEYTNYTRMIFFYPDKTPTLWSISKIYTPYISISYRCCIGKF